MAASYSDILLGQLEYFIGGTIVLWKGISASMPPGLPAIFGIGVLSKGLGTGDIDWMTGSGVPWTYRYNYQGETVDNACGTYVSDAVNNGYIQVITRYVYGDYTLTDTTSMNSYYASFVAQLKSMLGWNLWYATYNGNAVISTDGTTVTYTSTAVADCLVRGGNLHGSGKWVVRFHIVATSGIGFGISHNYQAGSYVGAASDSFGVYSGGYILAGNFVGSSPSITGTAGHDIDLAVDFDSKVFWIKETGGNWNGNAAYIPGDTHGISFSGITGSSWAPAVSLKNNGDQVTLTTPPSVTGFSAWNSTPSPAMILHLEPDMWGYMQQSGGPGGAQTDDATQVAISVASSGYSGLSGFANNAAGFAQALKYLRDTYAPQIILAWHCSTWGPSDGFIATRTNYGTLDHTPASTGQRVANFYNSLATRFDLIFHDTSTGDRDSDYALLNGGVPPIPTTAAAWWWVAQNFENYRLLLAGFHSAINNRAAGLLWQLPIGNTLYQTCNNTSFHYQDNKVEFFLKASVQGAVYDPGAIANFIAADIVGLLFGQGQALDTTNSNYAGLSSPSNPGAITNQNGWSGNTAIATVTDNDGGFLRLAAAQYYNNPTRLS